MNWTPPTRPAELTEQRLIQAILDGTFPAGQTLPGERDLSRQLGVTRPTLREALQRLARDGWLEINHGKPTLVKDIWRDGNLNVLSALVRYGQGLPPDFVTNLLQVRRAMAPAYAQAAVEQNPEGVAALLAQQADLADEPQALARFDWQLHRGLTLLSGNPVFTLILNGFADFYVRLATLYFARPEARASSRAFYADLAAAVDAGDPDAVQAITKRVMTDSIDLWQAVEM